MVDFTCLHQITCNDRPVWMMCNITWLHDCDFIIASLHGTYMTDDVTWPQRSHIDLGHLILTPLPSFRHARHARFFPRRSTSIRREIARGLLPPPSAGEDVKQSHVRRGFSFFTKYCFLLFWMMFLDYPDYMLVSLLTPFSRWWRCELLHVQFFPNEGHFLLSLVLTRDKNHFK